MARDKKNSARMRSFNVYLSRWKNMGALMENFPENGLRRRRGNPFRLAALQEQLDLLD